MDDYIPLGRTDIQVSRLGLGIMQWGDLDLNPRSAELNKDVQEIYQAALAGGINFFDTAEMYGNGKSEAQLGRCLIQIPKDIVIATKFMPFPWRLSKGELRKALHRSLKRLGLARVDLYQMHWPFPPVSIRTWMEAMSDMVADGLIRAVGVSNYSTKQTRVAYETLAKHHIPLASNQVRYNLLHRRPEQSGLADLCRQLGITMIAYSPLEKGILTGKYSPANVPADYRAMRYNRNYLVKIEPLMQALQQIGDSHSGKTKAQVALNWVRCKGAVPIPGARNKNQVQENTGGLGWELSAEEVIKLDHISDEVSRT